MLGDVIDPVMRSRLGDFERVGELKWVSEPIHHVRRIVEFQTMKGAEYSGRWGYSIDFVPALAGKNLLGNERRPKLSSISALIQSMNSDVFQIGAHSVELHPISIEPISGMRWQMLLSWILSLLRR